MDTNLLRTFLAVARLESFTAAAAELGYTQSTVTGHVQRLERQMESRLLDRLASGVVVTDVGARVVTHAEEVLAAEERLRAVSCPGPARPSGTVRLMAPESLCTYRLPGTIRAVREREPDVQVWLSPGGCDESLDAVRRGIVDVALLLEPQVPATDLTLERLGTEPLIFLDHGAREGTPATWSDLARRDALLIEEGCGYSDDVASHLMAAGGPAGRRSRFGSIEAIKQCVAVGLGWTALPAVTAQAELRSGQLTAIQGPALPDCEVHVATHPRRHYGPATGIVLTQLRQTWTARPGPAGP